MKHTLTIQLQIESDSPFPADLIEGIKTDALRLRLKLMPLYYMRSDIWLNEELLQP